MAELAQWGGVLRAAAGYHAFRRVARPGFTPEDVVAFLLDRHRLPAQRGAVRGGDGVALGQLRSRYGLRGTVAALETIEELRAAVLGRPVGRIIEGGLHEFLDGVQQDLILLAAEIGTAFFRDWRPLADRQPAPAAVITRPRRCVRQAPADGTDTPTSA